MRFRLAALLMCLQVPTAAQAAGKPFFPYPLTVSRLKNGLTVVTVPFSSPGIAAYYTVVRVGSRNEIEPGLTGFAHFFEHVMFKGTQRHPEGTRDAELAALGFSENAFTSDDVTVYHVTGPSTHLDKVVELEADRFQNLEYSEQTFQTEARTILGEYHKSAANPELKLSELLRATAFTRHSYRHVTLGYYEDIQHMHERYDDSKAFFRRWYTPDNTFIVVAGDFDQARLLKQIGGQYGSWRSKSARLALPVEPQQTSPRMAHLEWQTPTLPRHLHAWKVPALASNARDGAAAHVLGEYLAGPTSPLYDELVLQKQLVETLSGSAAPHRDPYLFVLRASLKDEKHREAVQAAMDTAVKQLIEGMVDRQRLAAAQSNLRYGLLMELQTPDALAEALADFISAAGSAQALPQHYDALSRVRPADLVAFARRFLVDAHRTVITLTHSEGATR